MSMVGFTNGCFDVLHVGHVRLFKFIKENCDTLVVGIDSDSRVKQLKGPTRPLNSQEDRAEMLLSLKAVDAVHIFDSPTELVELVKNTSPDVMVVGSDYRNKTVIGSQYAKKLLFFEKIDGHSTTRILDSYSHWR